MNSLWDTTLTTISSVYCVQNAVKDTKIRNTSENDNFEIKIESFSHSHIFSRYFSILISVCL